MAAETLRWKNVDLPTFDKLGVSPPDVSEEEARNIAEEWLTIFERNITSNNIDGIVSQLTEECWWRDLLAMTWDLRTFQAPESIGNFLKDRLAASKTKNFKLTIANYDQPYEDLGWIRLHWDFENHVGSGVGISRLVPTKGSGGSVVWKSTNICFSLLELKDHPPATGWLRDPDPNHGKWLDKRRREMEYQDRDPDVLVVGGGQSGLETAARLKLLGVSTLVVEKQARIGDQWRHRYSALCLHDVVCEFPLESRVFVILTCVRRVRSHAVHSVPGQLACLHSRSEGAF